MTNEPLPTVRQVADQFKIILRVWLTEDELSAVVAENARRDDNTCASHDYCDANMAMDEALQSFDVEISDEDDLIELFNSAWDLAKKEGFNNG